MIYLLVFLSGFAGLIYEVLWMKQVGLLFGSTSHAAAATLAAFFGGLAAGSWFWGRRSVKAANALRTYAWLEVGIAVTALLYFVILRCYYQIYPFVYQHVESTELLLLIKFALALLLIFPPAFCMGGTIPVIGQYMIRSQSAFGKTSAMLYGVNTLGAAAGATLAGFFLPLWLGFRGTCAGAMAITTLIAISAFLFSRKPLPDESTQYVPVNEVKNVRKKSKRRKPQETVTHKMPTGRWAVMLVCFLSGFGVLALEVLWMRMFSQVLENSVYTFSAILVIVLICLAAGALISSGLARLKVSPSFMLVILTLISGIIVATTPFVFMRLTNSMQILALKGSWFSYVMLIFKNGILTVGPPALLLGTVFPFLMKVEERYSISAGKSLGRLAAVNTVGAILGSLVCGFIFLKTMGMWRTMQIISAIYLVIALILPLRFDIKGLAVKALGVIFLVLLFTVLAPEQLPSHSVDKMRHQQDILETWEGSDCTVAVATDSYGVSIKINSHYSLGSTGALMQEKLQADIPLMIYPETESIFFLGMGTGITAGSALDEQFPNVERIVTCELVPEVITAAKKYIAGIGGFDYADRLTSDSHENLIAIDKWRYSARLVERLFTDKRSTVLAEDGRHYLMASGESFDMVNADLFVPYRTGAGSLYSKEHFESVKETLEPGGVFFQWLPLYQVTEYEFKTIARTMLEVFDQVSLWRNNFQPGEEVIVFAGHKDTQPLPASDIDSRGDKLKAIAGKSHYDLRHLSLPLNSQTILFFYCGNLTESKELFAGYPVNTDDKPVIEYMSPRTYRDKTDSPLPWFVGPTIARLVEDIQRRCPPDKDPLLVNRTPVNRRLPAAGAHFHRARIWEVIGNEEECIRSWQKFVKEWTNQK